MSTPESFADADQRYLRDEQYRDGSNLDARASLHQRFGTATTSFPDFVAGLIEWRPDLSILDCGAGTGLFWTNRHTPRSAAVTVTDLSPGMVATAAATARANGFDGVDSRECDVQELPFADASLDVVIANHMLYHVPDPDRAVSELARVVADDGIVVTATNGHGHMRQLTEIVDEVFGARSLAGQPVAAYDANRLYDAFGIDSGEARLRDRFASITWHAYDNDLVVDEPAAVVAYGRSFPPGDAADAEQAAAFEAAVDRRFADGPLRIRTRSGVFLSRRPRRPVDVGSRRLGRVVRS